MKRLNNISIFRIIATICILQFHIFYILYDRAIPYEMLLSKGVQGLTALSGFLYSQKLITNYKKFYLNNFIKLLVPALICVVFMVSWDFIYMIINQDFSYMAFFAERAYGGRLISQADNYYYLGYILILYLVTPLLQRNDKFSVITVSLIVLIEVLVGFFFGPAMIAVSYIAGYYIGKKTFKTYTDTSIKFSWPTLLRDLLITVGLVGIYILLQTYSWGDIYFVSRLHHLTNNIVMTGFGVSSFFLILIALKFLNNFKGLSIFKFTDKLAFIVYLMNQAFMCGAMATSSWVEPMWAKTILVYVFTLGFSVLLQFISNIVVNKITTKINKPQVGHG